MIESVSWVCLLKLCLHVFQPRIQRSPAIELERHARLALVGPECHADPQVSSWPLATPCPFLGQCCASAPIVFGLRASSAGVCGAGIGVAATGMGTFLTATVGALALALALALAGGFVLG